MSGRGPVKAFKASVCWGKLGVFVCKSLWPKYMGVCCLFKLVK